MLGTQQDIQLSVVLAAPQGGPNFSSCLEALKPQVSAAAVEIIVVDGSNTGLAMRGLEDLPTLRTIRLPGAEVPALWQAGIHASDGAIIALLIESCIPDRDWVSQTLRAHRAEWGAIGGAIDLAPTLGFVDSAIFFCRYSRYMPPFAPHFPEDLPGNTCSYKRTALQGLQKETADGFWETFVHREIRRRGDRLLCDPAIRAYHVGSGSGASFCRVRFVHGRRFAARRAARWNASQRIVRALASTLIPFLMLSRIAKGIVQKRRYRARFLACVPLLLVFLAVWSAGEFIGYTFGAARSPKEIETDSAEPSSASRADAPHSALGSGGG
jgi:hypothetical protein